MPGLSQDVEFYSQIFENWQFRLMGVQTILTKGSRLTGFLEMYASLDALRLLFEPLQLNSNASGDSMDHERNEESFWVFSVK